MAVDEQDPVRLAQRAAHFTLADLFRRSARAYADRIAVAAPERRLTYRELDERSDRLAQLLLARGLGHGDRLAALAPTRPEYVELYVAAAKAGITVVALNTRLALEEQRHCLQLGDPRLLVADPSMGERARALGGEILWLPETPGDAASDFEAELAAAEATPPPAVSEPEDIHCVLFTSGTTGRPKGAMISQRASVTRAFRVVDWYELTPEDGMIGWIPMFHTGGDECLQSTLLSGGTFATLPSADPVTLFTAIERDRLTWTAMLPGVITDFLDHPRREEFDLSSLRFTLGYANMMPQVVERFTAATDSVFWDTFGQTESSFVVALDPVHPGETPSLRKRPAPLLDVRIVDEDLLEQPVGVPGECVVRGPSVMSGYLGDPAATAEAFHGGWLHTGDVLVRHEDGRLTYVDRLKYLIKTGGENVYPAEVEQVVTAHPAVREACAISVPDERWGETVKVVVVLAPDATLAPDELDAWCAERLTGFKRPRYLEIVTDEEVPRSTTGKIQRHELARRAVTPEQRLR